MSTKIPCDITCPRCDGHVDALVATRWGTPGACNDWPLQPYICGWCGSLLLIEFKTKALFVPGAEGLAALERNPVLWDAITKGRAQILALPDRRPVKR